MTKLFNWQKRSEEIDAALPWTLRSMAIELSLGVPFEAALRHSTAEGGALGEELGKAAAEIEYGGSSVQGALSNIAVRCGSLSVRRAVAELVHCYEHGEKGEGLKRLAGEIAQVQGIRAKEYSARASLIGLAFIAVSCISPALFLTFAVVSSSFSDAIFSPSQIWLFFVFGFPCAGAVLLAIAWLLMPACLKLSRQGSIFSREELGHVQRLLAAKGIGAKIETLGVISFCISSVLAAVSYSLLAHTSAGADRALQLAIPLLVFLLPALVYFHLAGMARKRGAAMERFLPDALFQASSMQAGVKFERLISSIAHSGYGPLSDEFAAVHRQMRAGASATHALEGMMQRCDSMLVQRALRLLVQAYRNGSGMGWAMKECAEDILGISSALWERKALLAVQRYTLLGGGLLVPLVLGLITHAVSGLDLGSMGGLAAEQTERTALLSAAVGAGEIYLLAFALLTSLFTAVLDGEWKRFVSYATLLTPAGLALFTFARLHGI